MVSDKKKAYMKSYRELHKDEIELKGKQYRELHAEELKKKRKERNRANKQKKHDYYISRKDIVAEQSKKHIMILIKTNIKHIEKTTNGRLQIEQNNTKKITRRKEKRMV